MLVLIYTCQNATLLEIICPGSFVDHTQQNQVFLQHGPHCIAVPDDLFYLRIEYSTDPDKLSHSAISYGSTILVFTIS